MITKTKNYTPNYPISKNFIMKNFASPDGYVIWDHTIGMFVDMVQEFRDWYNRPIVPSSWFRTVEFNKTLKGYSATSMHLQGLAIDIPYPTEYFGFTAERKKEFQKNIETKWREICRKYGRLGSLEICDRHFHLDCRNWADGKFHLYYGKSV